LLNFSNTKIHLHVLDLSTIIATKKQETGPKSKKQAQKARNRQRRPIGTSPRRFNNGREWLDSSVSILKRNLRPCANFV